MDPPLSLKDGHHSTEHRDHQQKDVGSLEQEKKLRMDLQEDLKRSQQSILDLKRDKQQSDHKITEQEEEIKKNVEEITFLLNKIEDAQSSVHLQKTIKEKQARIKEVQEELDAEHAARCNVEKQRDDLHLDLERAERDNRKLEEDLKRSQESIMDLQRDKQQSDQGSLEQEKKLRMDLQEDLKRSIMDLQRYLNKPGRIIELEEAELRRSYAVNVVLDPDTAQHALILSDDGKQVSFGTEGIWNLTKNVWNYYFTSNAERFCVRACVLGKQSFSSGRFYFEVQVKRKTEWTLGVARESIDRNEADTIPPYKPSNGYWNIWLRNGNEYVARADPPVPLPVREEVQTVGVFVDYEGGLVSFHDVEARVHLYSFTGCTFTEKLYPFFSPALNEDGINSAPLIIM